MQQTDDGHSFIVVETMDAESPMSLCFWLRDDGNANAAQELAKVLNRGIRHIEFGER